MRYGLRPAPPCQICRPRSGAFQHCQRKQRHNDLTAVADETRSAYPVIVLSDSAAALHVCRLAWDDDDNAVLLCTSVGMDALVVVARRDHLPNLFVPLGERLTLTSGRTSCRSVFASSGSREQSRTLHPSIRPCFPSIPLPADPPLIPPMFSRLPPRSLLWSLG